VLFPFPVSGQTSPSPLLFLMGVPLPTLPPPHMYNNVKQPELPGTKPLPIDYTWTDPGL